MKPKLRRDFKNGMLATWSDEEDAVEGQHPSDDDNDEGFKSGAYISTKENEKCWPIMNSRMACASWPYVSLR